jgi:hypothetical protein
LSAVCWADASAGLRVAKKVFVLVG